MRNVTVYGNKEVVIDGQLVSKVLAVNPPTRDKPIPSIELHIDGALTYTPEKYMTPPMPPQPRTITHTELYDSLTAGRLSYDSYIQMHNHYFPNIPAAPKPLITTR